MRKIVVLSLLLILIIAAFCPTAAADKTEAPEPAYFDLPVPVDTVRVGLAFGDAVISCAELQSKTEDGFRIGYFDFARVFHEILSCDFTSLSISPDTGFVRNDGSAAGPWHILYNEVFDSYDKAKAFADSIKDGFTGLIDGGYRVLSSSFAERSDAGIAIAEQGIDASAYSGSDFSVTVSESDSSKLIFIMDNGENTALGVNPVSDEGTWYASNAYCGGFEFKRSGQKLKVINYIELESYVKGVLPYEMVASWPAEALKAQGICARTYAINSLNKFEAEGFDLRNDTYSQVYKGLTGTADTANAAAEATSGSLIRYRGAPCRIYYMSSDGGATASSSDIFSCRRAYLSGIEDHSEDGIDFYNKTWKAVLREDTIVQRLKNYGVEIKDVESLDAEKSDTGIVVKLTVTDRNGKKAELYGENCFLGLSLFSNNFNITQLGGDIWEFSGRGWGHNCGMSQWGAYAMARDKNARCADIIDHYFTGAYIA